MNVAILIGVTSYSRPVTDLPACAHDVQLMSQLIRHTNRFPDTLELGKNTSSAEVKTQLAQFVSKFKGQKVDELFFYYSGHGDLFKDDFYFLFSDFDEKRRNQTSLTNNELDSMLKTLAPKLIVKVVDACHAGVAYVKEPDALAKQLQATQASFSNCYFMFSSQSSQSSFQDSKLSDFTESFVEACSTFTG
jgi:Caspase domain